MQLKNPHTGLPVEPAPYEPRARPEPTPPAAAPEPSPPSDAPPEAPNATEALAGLPASVLARCLEEGVSIVFVRKLLRERTAAKAALDGIDHVLAMLGIEAIP